VLAAKKLPVISREYFRKTSVPNTFINTYLIISNVNLQNGISNTSILRSNWYFKYQLVLQIPIGTSNTNWYFKYQLILQIPIGTSNTNWYFKYQLVPFDLSGLGHVRTECVFNGLVWFTFRPKSAKILK
jgi:hypothetical protein